MQKVRRSQAVVYTVLHDDLSVDIYTTSQIEGMVFLAIFLVSAGKPTALAVSKAGFPPTSDIVTAVADVCLRFREAFFSEGVYLHPQQSLLCAMEAVERR